eukprot:403362769
MRKELSFNSSLNTSVVPSKRNSLSKDGHMKMQSIYNENNNFKYSMSFASPRDQEKINLEKVMINTKQAQTTKNRKTQSMNVQNAQSKKELSKKIVDSILNSPSNSGQPKSKIVSRQDSREKSQNFSSPFKQLNINQYNSQKQQALKKEVKQSFILKAKTHEGGTGGSHSINVYNSKPQTQNLSQPKKNIIMKKAQVQKPKGHKKTFSQPHFQIPTITINNNNQNFNNLSNLDISGDASSLDLSKIFTGLNQTPIGHLNTSGPNTNFSKQLANQNQNILGSSSQQSYPSRLSSYGNQQQQNLTPPSQMQGPLFNWQNQQMSHIQTMNDPNRTPGFQNKQMVQNYEELYLKEPQIINANIQNNNNRQQLPHSMPNSLQNTLNQPINLQNMLNNINQRQQQQLQQNNIHKPSFVINLNELSKQIY